MVKDKVFPNNVTDESEKEFNPTKIEEMIPKRKKNSIIHQQAVFSNRNIEKNAIAIA